jgi:uncharacterized protein VirK/YbjX
MALTRRFEETVMERARHDKAFREGTLIESINEFLTGNIDVAKEMLRDYINATLSLQPIAKAIHKDTKSIKRMLSTEGNPSCRSFSQLISFLQKHEKIHLEVKIT